MLTPIENCTITEKYFEFACLTTVAVVVIPDIAFGENW